ncbi:MAG: SAVED domain-containing protein [Clostridia bacterium]|nr:SAVED domain-containing protein [Clostridia bacterium]
MANASIAARNLGDDYQVYYFWQNAIRMLSNDLILAVSYEEGDVLPFDDVTVFYSQQIKNEYTDTYYDRDFYQCKFKVNASSLKWEDLIDPDYYGNKESLFQRAYNLCKKQPDGNFRLALCTSITFDNGDTLRSYLKMAENGLDVDSMFSATDKKTRAMLKTIKSHLGNITDDELKALLSHFRFFVGRSLHDIKGILNDYCAMAGVEYDLSTDAEFWTSIIKRCNLRKQTSHDKASIRTICVNENLFRPDRVDIGIIGIGRSDDRTERIKTFGVNGLDLSKYFVDRKLAPAVTWAEVISDTKSFVSSQIKHGQSYNLTVAGIFSTAFMLGKIMGFKNGDIALRNRNGLWVKSLAIKSDIIYTDEVCYSDMVNDTADDVVLSISVAQNSIFSDVKDCFTGTLTAPHIINIHRAMDDITNNAVWDFANDCHNTVLEFLKRKKPKNIHLFYRGPAELMFILGQYANEWGECQIYDFDFGAASIGEKKYYKGIKI